MFSTKLQKLQDEVDRIFEELKKFKVEERDSALKEFAKVYTIKGIEGYDARSFLLCAFQSMTSVLWDNRKTKVKLIFKCKIELLKTSETIERNFHSGIEVNLDGTDERDLYITMTERILQELATFIAKDTKSRFHSIIRLELHTVRYKPLRGETYIPYPKS